MTISQLKTLDIGSRLLATDPFKMILSKNTSTEQLPKKIPPSKMTREVAAYQPKDDITDAFLIKKHRAAGFGVNVLR